MIEPLYSKNGENKNSEAGSDFECDILDDEKWDTDIEEPGKQNTKFYQILWTPMNYARKKLILHKKYFCPKN